MRIRLLAAGALTVATVAACSSSGGTTSGTGSNGGGNSGGGVTTSSTPMSSSTSGGGGSPQAFCGELKSAQQKLSKLTGSLGSSPAQAGNKLDPIISELQQLKADAPAQLQSEFGDLASAFQKIKQAGTGTNLKAIAKQLQKVTPKLQKDGTTIEHYLATKC